MKNPWKVNCPNCSSSIWYWKVRNTFSCTHCGVSIESNWGTATGICIVAVVIALPFLIPLASWGTSMFLGKDAAYLDWRVILATMEFVVVTLVYPIALRLKIAEFKEPSSI